MENENCIFCRIAANEFNTPLLYEDEDIIAFKDIQPHAPVHVLIIPRRHIPDLASMGAGDIELLGRMNYVAIKLAEQLDIAESGYRLLTNCRADSGQEVPHLHFHLIGGKFLGPFTL
jgi:histidine triad (HIT) family protein